MTTVNNFIRSIDSKAWHTVEEIASKHTTAVSLLTIPIALATLIRDTIETPAKCIEEVILTGKSIKDYLVEKDPQQFFDKSNEVQIHSTYAFVYLIKTPFAPLIGLIDAIVSFVKMTLFPLKTAKINAAKQDFSLLLLEEKYTANEIKYAETAFNRFKDQIIKAQGNREINKIHFLDILQYKQEIVNEIKIKKLLLDKAYNDYDVKLKQLFNNTLNTSEVNVANMKKLNEAFEEFKIKLIHATQADACKMSFNPTFSK